MSTVDSMDSDSLGAIDPGSGSTDAFTNVADTVAASPAALKSMLAAPESGMPPDDVPGSLIELSKAHLFGYSASQLEGIIAKAGHTIRRVTPDLLFVPEDVWENHIRKKPADAHWSFHP